MNNIWILFERLSKTHVNPFLLASYESETNNIKSRVDRCDSKDKDKDKIAEIWWNKSTW